MGVTKVMPYVLSPNGSAGGCFLAYAVSGGISPLTCTIFDLSIFLIFSKYIFSHISPASPKLSIMGNYLDFALKIAHRGNTGSHRGKRKLLCVPKEWICALLLVFLCFCSMA